MRYARIGAWPPLPPGAIVRGVATERPFPLGAEGCRLYSRARHGVWHGVRAIGLGPGDGVLVPACHHGAEVEALARAGLALHFYDGSRDLEPDADELLRALLPGTRALYLIHHLGFPQDGARWRAWCDEHGLLLIEDASQAWLASVGGRPVGSFGDLSIFCFHRAFGLPDGAAAVVRPPREPASAPAGEAPLGLTGMLWRNALWVLQRSPGLSVLAPPVASNGTGDALALGDLDRPPAAATTRLLERMPDERAAVRRRAHYTALLHDLGDQVSHPFDRVPVGASPLAFPLDVDHKPQVLTRLAAHGIAAVDAWPAPHPALDVARFPEAARRRARSIALPVHQELRPRDLERIAAVASRSPRRRPALYLEPLGDLDAARDEWSQLAERTQNVFSTWEWASTWWRRFGRDRPQHIVAIRDAGRRLRGILPLYQYAGRPLRVLRFIGHGPADELGPICAPEDRVEVARHLRKAVEGLRADVLLAERLIGDQGWQGLLGGQVLKHEASPIVDFGEVDSWDALRAGWSHNWRHQLGRKERKLEREHDVRFRLTTTTDGLEAELEALFSLHEARWGSGANSFVGNHGSFHREFAHVAAERGWLRLWILEVDGGPVAGMLVYRFGGVDAFYQAGRDPEWEKQSVGTVLIARVIRESIGDGMPEFRMLRGDEPYKYRFTNRDPGVDTLAVSFRPLGAAAVGCARMIPDSVAASLRQWVNG
jgi:CelD/BcsL family acetyltransferase involved in cellulose biosynthesis